MARDTEEVRFRFHGDHAAAKQLIDYGRKLLGYVREQMGYHGLEQYALKKTLPDGRTVTAAHRFGQSEITISIPSSFGGLSNETPTTTQPSIPTPEFPSEEWKPDEFEYKTDDDESHEPEPYTFGFRFSTANDWTWDSICLVGSQLGGFPICLSRQWTALYTVPTTQNWSAAKTIINVWNSWFPKNRCPDLPDSVYWGGWAYNGTDPCSTYAGHGAWTHMGSRVLDDPGGVHPFAEGTYTVDYPDNVGPSDCRMVRQMYQSTGIMFPNQGGSGDVYYARENAGPFVAYSDGGSYGGPCSYRVTITPYGLYVYRWEGSTYTIFMNGSHGYGFYDSHGNLAGLP